MKISLDTLVSKNRTWFAPGNASFFGDKRYFTMTGKQSGKTFLIRYSSAWSDMFDKEKKYNYYINYIDDDLKIGTFVEKDHLPAEFRTLDNVKDWLQDN